MTSRTAEEVARTIKESIQKHSKALSNRETWVSRKSEEDKKRHDELPLCVSNGWFKVRVHELEPKYSLHCDRSELLMQRDLVVGGYRYTAGRSNYGFSPLVRRGNTPVVFTLCIWGTREYILKYYNPRLYDISAPKATGDIICCIDTTLWKFGERKHVKLQIGNFIITFDRLENDSRGHTFETAAIRNIVIYQYHKVPRFHSFEDVFIKTIN